MVIKDGTRIIGARGALKGHKGVVLSVNRSSNSAIPAKYTVQWDDDESTDHNLDKKDIKQENSSIASSQRLSSRKRTHAALESDDDFQYDEDTTMDIAHYNRSKNNILSDEEEESDDFLLAHDEAAVYEQELREMDE
jgi:ribosomal protein L24